MPKRKIKSRRCNSNCKSDNTDDSDSSWEDEEQLIIDNPNQISRWGQMLNKSENINLTFLQILKEMEDNIVERIDVFQKDLESKIEIKFSGTEKKPEKVFKSANVKELINELEVSFPFKDIESFEAFDNELENDSNKIDALRELFLQYIDGTSRVSKDVYNLLKFLLAESVLIQFTSTGKKFRGKKKKNFSSTNVYLCMEDVLTHKHNKPASTLKLTTVFSNYFARINFKNKPVDLKNNGLNGNLEE